MQQRFGAGNPSGKQGGFGKGGGRGPKGRQGAGPGGQCICPSCNTVLPHQQGTPCSEMKCPQCGIAMIRQMEVR